VKLKRVWRQLALGILCLGIAAAGGRLLWPGSPCGYWVFPGHRSAGEVAPYLVHCDGGAVREYSLRSGLRVYLADGKVYQGATCVRVDGRRCLLQPPNAFGDQPVALCGGWFLGRLAPLHSPPGKVMWGHREIRPWVIKRYLRAASQVSER